MAVTIAGLFVVASPFILARSNPFTQFCNGNRQFVTVPAGEFEFGSDRAERDYAYTISARALATTPARQTQVETQLRQAAWFEEEPQRQRRSLPEFCISQFPVTNAEYREFLQATGHRQPGISESDYNQQGFLVHPYSKVEEFLWQDGEFPVGTDSHPVVLVSYEDALTYAEWKSDQLGIPLRLPTADEWEKAARGPSGQYFPWGNEWQPQATNAAPSEIAYTSRVDAFALSVSSFGVGDASGNVFEFTSTELQHNGQTHSVMKGCSWDDLPGFCRAAYRHTRPSSSRHILFGFRLVQPPS